MTISVMSSMGVVTMSVGAYQLIERPKSRIGKLFLNTRLKKGLKQREVAKRIGHSAARISQIESGDVPSVELALHIARVLELDSSEVLKLLNQDKVDKAMETLAARTQSLASGIMPDLVPGEIDIPDKTQLEPIRIHWVPVVGVIPAGRPVEVSQETAEEHVPVETRRVPEAVRLYALRVEGDSMVKWGIQHGDIVTVDPEAQWSEGDEVVVSINDKWTLKKIRTVAGGILLEAATNDQSIILTEDSGQVEIKGVVVNLTKDRRRLA